CVIEGEVENSILFRGVKVKRGAVVKNCILMQNTQVSENATVNCIITDKNVLIKERSILSGSDEHPFYLSKNARA
ncbi:MAG: glucose-1-phosphate adenylyltransferase subunit GlgD, partial [Clostridia bacterium]|nr:glucose-1-phosphate adenylyltransferase subunit GlgD [Clostridia bacterium]